MSNLNWDQILQLAEQIGLDQIDAGLGISVKVAMMVNPTFTDQQIADMVNGSMKHSTRSKIGVAVDFIWPFVEPVLRTQITSEAQKIRSNAALSQLSGTAVNSVMNLGNIVK